MNPEQEEEREKEKKHLFSIVPAMLQVSILFVVALRNLNKHWYDLLIAIVAGCLVVLMVVLFSLRVRDYYQRYMKEEDDSNGKQA